MPAPLPVLRLTNFRRCCAGWHHAFADPLASCTEDFETKRQLINRLQEGQPFGEVRAARALRASLGPKAESRPGDAGRPPHAAHVSRHGRGVPDAGAHTGCRVHASLVLLLTENAVSRSGRLRTRCPLTCRRRSSLSESTGTLHRLRCALLFPAPRSRCVAHPGDWWREVRSR